MHLPRLSRFVFPALLALAIGFGFASSSSRAQDAQAPSGAPWGSRTGGEASPRTLIKATTQTPENPSPGRPSGTQRAALRTLSGGSALPPPALALLEDGLSTRALHHGLRADTLDALAVRSARRMQALAGVTPSREACLSANAARRAMELAIEAGIQRGDTAAALAAEATTGRDARGVVQPSASRRLRELDEQASSTLIPHLEEWDCGPETSRFGKRGMEPRVHLPAEARRPHQGRVAFFVKVPPGDSIIWIDGEPEGLAAEDGWGVVTAPARAVTLCSAPPEGGQCDPTHRVVPSMGDAYDLRVSEG